MDESEHELARLVGEVAIESARAEYAVKTLLVALLESPYGEVLLAQRGFAAMIQDCQAILPLHLRLDGNPQRERPLELLNEMDRLRPARNKVVHGILAVSPSNVGQDEPAQVTAEHNSPRRPARLARFTVDEVREAVSQLRYVTDELLNWTLANLDEYRQVLPAEEEGPLR